MKTEEMTRESTRLIADSGSTKTDWWLVSRGEVRKKMRTQGLNPYFSPMKSILFEIETHVTNQLDTDEVTQLFFYGAGCADERNVMTIKQVLRQCFPHAQLNVTGDLLGAAQALFQHRPGIACILGTGSNSCQYDGRQIVRNVAPLGYLLGDEGSATALGKKLINSALKNLLPPQIKQALLDHLRMTPGEIISEVYRNPSPNRFLASLSPFIRTQLHHPEIRQMVQEAFSEFFQRNLLQYDLTRYSVSFVGSVAYHFKDILLQTARTFDAHIEQITPSPMRGLVQYTGSKSEENPAPGKKANKANC